ncbi:MAG: T9SS type A sorting domain-containing protein [Bacteroidia bacterium]|nr:T9SS type A sorting domain-containing protein [Bacteroidia bacterium]
MKKLLLCVPLIVLFQFSKAQIAFNLGSSFQDRATAIDRDEAGNIYLTGSFQDSFDLDPGSASSNLLAQGDAVSPDSQDVFLARYNPDGSLAWGFAISSPGRDKSFAVEAIGGFVFVCGFIQGEADFDPAVTTAILNSGSGQDAFIAAYDTLGNFRWAQVLGDDEGAPFLPEDDRYELAYDLSADGSGNVYVAGVFEGIIDFEPNNSSPFDSFFSVNDGNGLPSQDIFVVSYDPVGNYRWGFGVGGMESEEAQAIRFRQGQLFVGGKFRGTTDLNPSGQQRNFSSNGDYDAFLARYQASDGTFDWGHSWGSGGIDEVAQGAIDFNLGGQLFVGGNFEGNVDFDPGAALQEISSQGMSDMYISRFELDGTYGWTRRDGGTGIDRLTDVGVDNPGFVYTSGSTEGLLYVRRRDRDGNPSWEQQLGVIQANDPLSQSVENMFISELGDIYFCGGFYQSMDVDPGVNELNLISEGGRDAFVLRFSPEGSLGIFGTSRNPDFSSLAESWKLYPNPSQSHINLELSWRKSSDFRLEILNLHGQRVWEKEYLTQSGNQHYFLQIEELPAGWYLLRGESEGATFVEKVRKR